jgi:hypothetical protein
MLVRYEWGVDLSDPVTGTYDEVCIDCVMPAKDFPQVVKSSRRKCRGKVGYGNKPP